MFIQVTFVYQIWDWQSTFLTGSQSGVEWAHLDTWVREGIRAGPCLIVSVDFLKMVSTKELLV